MVKIASTTAYYCILTTALLVLSATLVESAMPSRRAHEKHMLRTMFQDEEFKAKLSDTLESNKNLNLTATSTNENVYACQFCKLTIFSIDKILMSNKFYYLASNGFKLLCPLVVTNASECTGSIDQEGPILFTALTAGLLDPDYICTISLPFCLYSEFEILTAEGFAKRVLRDKPLKIQDNNYTNKLYAKINGFDKRPRLTMVHMADPHLDFEYAVGSDALCNGEMCCRSENGFPNEVERQAGEWGGYKCDLPEKTYVSFLEYVRDTIQPDLFFWTGDNTAHDVWKISKNTTITATLNATQLIKDVFEDSNITVYPIHANHDVWPPNIQDFNGPTDEIIAYGEAWADWLDNDTVTQYSEYGYYYQVMKMKDGTTYDNTYVIALNTNACYVFNFALLNNRRDPGGQMAWLEEVLQEIENNNGQAIIISHIPTNHDCVHEWGYRYRALADRYQHVIRLGLFGHTHFEELMISRSFIDDRNIGINWISGSLTTFVDLNPSFVVMELDEEYMLPVSIKTYYLNLTKANSENVTTWELLIDYASDYNMTDMSPDSFGLLAKQVRENETTAIKYAWNMNKQVSYTKLDSCDQNCRRELSCYMSSTEYYQIQLCNGRVYYDFFHETGMSAFNLLYGDWFIDADDED